MEYEPVYWVGYHDCRGDLRDLLEKTADQPPESRLAVVAAFLIEDELTND